MPVEYRFSPLDEIMPHLTITLMFCFPCQTSKKDAVYHNLRAGLLALVERLPFLSGRVVRNTNEAEKNGKRPGGMSLVIEDPQESIELELNDLTAEDCGWEYSYDELRGRGMPMSELDGRLFAPGGSNEMLASDKVFRSRITFIPGGCFVCASSSHAYFDAWGFVVLMNTWAFECRLVQSSSQVEPKLEMLQAGRLPPALSRHVPRLQYDDLKRKPHLWKLLGLDWRDLNADSGAVVPYAVKPVINTSIFSFSPKSLDDLAELGTPDEDDFDDQEPIWVSPNDTLIAFLWRSILKARAPSWIGGPHRKDSMVSVAINGRRVLYPAVPMSYIGNVVFCCLTELPIEQLIAPRTKLATIALALRRSIEASLDSQVLANTVDLAGCIPDVRKLGNAFTSWFAEELVTTSVVDLPVYDTSWGGLLGKPEFFRLPRGQFGGICSVQPRRPDGSVEVFISLMEEEMTRLRQDTSFSKYASFVAS
ncbi:MAG: hypothetical protein Q9218_002842 [Villophora microphyllina]